MCSDFSLNKVKVHSQSASLMTLFQNSFETPVDRVCRPKAIPRPETRYGWMDGHIHSKSMDQPGKVANPARGQLNRENEYFPVPVLSLSGAAGDEP